MADGPIAQGPNLHALGLLDAKGGGDGSNEQKNIIDALIVEPIGPKLAGTVAKLGVGVDLSNPEGGAPVKAIDSNGFKDAKMPGLASMNSGQESGPFGFILKALKMVFSNSKIEDQTGGVGGDANALAQGAPQIEAPNHNVDFSALIGSNEGMGRYSVADISGGGTLTPIGPAGGGRGMEIG